MIRWLRQFFGSRRPNGPDVRVVVYTRQSCHLCEDAEAQLRQRQGRYGFTLELVDVDTDPALAARHGEWVPVVTVNGKERFRGRVNSVLLDRLLSAETRRGAG